MTGWWAALAVVGAALVLLVLTERSVAYEARWVRRVAADVDPPETAAGTSLPPGLELSVAEQVPEAIRPLCPPPPFTALVYHHTCGSCRRLWAEVVGAPELDDVVLVHDADKEDRLRRDGILREPAIALPGDVMDALPSGLALRVDAGWLIAATEPVDSLADLRALHVDRVGTP